MAAKPSISIQNKKHRNAIGYFQQWGGTFWQETDFRVREIVTNFENQVAAQVGVSAKNLSAKLESKDKVSQQDKIDVTHRGQNIIDSVHMRELSDIVDTVDHILDDPQRPYYIIVDRLDENWVDDSLRYLLIRALIETVRDFTPVANLKIVVAIRYDLLERVFHRTRDSGFQQEKYRSQFLDLSWTSQQLTEIVDKRLPQLVSFRYGKLAITHKEVLPRLKGSRNKTAIEYMIDRTLMRPRDIIVFFNLCIAQAIGKDRITMQNLKAAEGLYSRDRLDSLQYEWYTDYPNLARFAEAILSRMPHRFTVDDLDAGRLQDVALEAVIENLNRDDPVVSASYSLVDERISVPEFKLFIANVFYSVGLLGLKRLTSESFNYVGTGMRSISKTEITKRSHAEIHPCFWRALGIADAHHDLEGRRPAKTDI